jgi:hypothetical protein
MSEETNDQTLNPQTIEMTIRVPEPSLWLSENYAPFWFADALHEARNGTDHHATRREIIFVTCFLESFIFEWARTKLRNLEDLNTHFPPRKRRKLNYKWKLIPIDLYNNGELPSKPQLDLTRLNTLVDYRNGLVHARASRPANLSGKQNQDAQFIAVCSSPKNKEYSPESIAILLISVFF